MTFYDKNLQFVVFFFHYVVIFLTKIFMLVTFLSLGSDFL